LTVGTIQKQTINSSIFIYVGAAIGFVTSCLLFPKLLDTKQIGLLNILISYSMVFSQVGGMGFNTVINRMFPRFRNPNNHHNGFLSIGMAVTLGGCVLASVGLVVFYYVIYPEKSVDSPMLIENYFYLFPLMFFTTFFNFFDSYNTILYNSTRGIFLKEFLVRAIVLLAIVVYAFGLMDFDGFLLLYVVAFSAPAVVIVYMLRREGQVSFRSNVGFLTKDMRREMTSLCFNGILISAATIVTLNVDRIMVESMLGSDGLAAVGVYSTCFFFGTAISLPSRALVRASVPVISDALNRNDLDEVNDVYSRSAITQFIVGTLMFIGIWVNIDSIFDILSDRFAEGRYVIFFIGLAFLSDMLAGVCLTILGISKYYRSQTLFIFIMIALAIITNLIFIPKLGIVGAAIATFISKLIVNVLRFFYMRSKYRLQPYNYKFVLVAAIGVVAYLAGYLMPCADNVLLNIAIKSVPTGVVFCLLVLVFRCSDNINRFAYGLLGKFLKRKG